MHTMLSELYQERLETEEEVKRMKEEWYLPYRHVPIDASLLDMEEEESRQLRGW